MISFDRKMKGYSRMAFDRGIKEYSKIAFGYKSKRTL